MTINEQKDQVCRYFGLDPKNAAEEKLIPLLIKMTAHKPTMCRVDIQKINNKLEVTFIATMTFEQEKNVHIFLAGNAAIMPNNDIHFLELLATDMADHQGSLLDGVKEGFKVSLTKFVNNDIRQTKLLGEEILNAMN